ncbi:MAG: amidohydrolase family protein [Acidobacteriota bacterium]
MSDKTFSRLMRKAAVHRAKFYIFLALVAGLAFVLNSSQTARLDDADAYAIKDAQIVTGTGKTIAKGTIVFRNGLITEVGENVKIPADARIINGAGMVVYPGFIDGYTNLGLPAPQQPATPAAGGAGGRQAAIAAAAAAGQQPESNTGDPSNSAAEQVKPGGTNVEDARNAGITTALTSARQGIFAGQSALINLAGDDAAKLVLRSPVALTVQFSTGSFFGGGYPGSLMGTVSYIRQTFYDAVHYRDEWDRYNRIKRGIARPQTDKKLAALQPALRGEMPVMFIANSDQDIRRALMIADEFKLKPIIGGALYGYRIADRLKAKNIPVVLSVDFPARATDLPDDEDEPIRVLRMRAETPKGAAMLNQAGVKFAFTAGTQRPADFLSSVRRAVENGLSKDEALKALTINAAEIFGVSEQLGTIEAGKIANLVVMSGDLFARESRVRHVFIDGLQFEVRNTPPQQQRFGGGQGRPGGPGAPPQQARIADPSGEWSLMVNSPQGDLNVKMNIRKDGNNYSGSLATPMGNADVRDIAMEGNRLTARVTIPAGGNNMEATMTATIDGDAIKGVLALGAMGAFDFTGTRPK